MPDNEQKNPAKPFWSGLNYIMDVLHAKMVRTETVVTMRGSITLSIDEWQAIADHYASLEKAILDTWEDAIGLEADFGDMRGPDPNTLEDYRKAGKMRTEDMISRISNYVDNEKVEI